MTKSGYRNSCKDGVTFSDLKDDPEYFRDGEELILTSEVEQIIDDIENDAKNKAFDSKQYRVYSTFGKSTTICGQGGGVGAKNRFVYCTSIPIWYR